MYTADMFDKNGRTVLGRATVTMDHANQLRNQGGAGGQGTVSGEGRQEV
jgi:hypothetical protein